MIRSIIIALSLLLMSTNISAETEDEKIFNAGVNYYTSAEYKLAKRYFDKYIFLYPDKKYTIDAYLYLSKIAVKDRDYNRAIKLIEKIIKLFSTEIDIGKYYSKIGDIYFQIGDYDKAEQIYNKVVTKFPESSAIEQAQIMLEQIKQLTSED